MAIPAAPICTVCHYQAFYHLGYFFIGFCNSQHSIPAPNYKCPTKSQNVGKINNNQEGEKAVHGGDRKSTDAKSSSLNANLIDSSKTCDRIAEENGVSRASVLRASHYTRGIDITDNRSPGIKQKVLRLAGSLHGTVRKASGHLSGRRHLHLANTRPFGRSKAPLGLLLLRKRELALAGRTGSLYPRQKKNRAFPTGNALLYISLSSVVFYRVRPIQGCTLFFYYDSSFSTRSIRYPTPTWV